VTSGSASDFSVGTSAGSVVLRAAATGGGARLLGVSSRDVELEGVVRSSAASSGFGQQVSLVARRVRNNREYRVRVRFAANGQVFVGVFKMLGTGTEVAVGPEVLVGGTTFSPGVNYRVRARFLGASPTTITTSVWVDGQAAPGSWQLTRTDSESMLQAAGATGLHTVLSSTATVVPVTFSFGSFSVEQATAAPT
jgi:hypothetical protein